MPDATTRIRLLELDDAEALATHLHRDRDELARWDPAQPAAYYTPEGQRSRVERLLRDHEQGLTHPAVVLADGVVIGQATVTSIVRGAFLKGSIGYWVGGTHQGRGHATRALAQLLRVMTDDLGLHRAEASAQPENHASHRVLRANGFTVCGIAHSHIFVNGGWRDGILWERTLDA